MAKCKICKEEIMMVVFGSPDDICWGCLNKEDKDKVVDVNIKVEKRKKV